ncbi:bifunctional 4-hydroxy-2-oxoglutarate aldolase/2-dehydro-3-deoxy-phosphogluconate aldolase [Echinicola sediminis]
MNKKFSEEKFQAVPMIGILRGYKLEEILKITETYLKAGFTTLEITLNTPSALEIISTVVQKFGNDLNVGAGTVCDLEDLNQAIDAGAQFVVSPIIDLDVIHKCCNMEVPIFPGALTPTEIYKAWTAGARMVKLFPGNAFTPTYVKDILAPLTEIQIMPTGGVSFQNLIEFHKAGAKAFGMGDNLFDPVLINNQDWEALHCHMLIFKELINKMNN